MDDFNNVTDENTDSKESKKWYELSLVQALAVAIYAALFLASYRALLKRALIATPNSMGESF